MVVGDRLGWEIDFLLLGVIWATVRVHRLTSPSLSFTAGRESKRKIVLTHPIEVENETALTDASALHDTPPNVNQYHHHKTKSLPKEHRSDNNKIPQQLQEQQPLHQQQSRALIHADDRKATTTHAGHTPKSDRKRRERRKTGRASCAYVSTGRKEKKQEKKE